MLDKDFELQSEQSLIIPQNYFDRYAALYRVYGNAAKAWETLEQELHDQTGGNRFSSLQSFQAAQTRFHAGERSRSVLIKIDS